MWKVTSFTFRMKKPQRRYIKMAISFNQQKGSAQKTSISTLQYRDGDNSMRIVGDILARYVYWVKGENDKNIPLECLSFDRNTETFNNKEKDWKNCRKGGIVLGLTCICS